ncbi:MAG: hypothetical protein KGH56_02175 [Patescibacteria group bacterium]|nr:hypothetical protein [Patescibacteria group bacterium]
MTIPEARERCKALIALVPRDALIVAILVLASSLSFGLGYLAGLDAGHSTTISFENDPGISPAAAAAAGQVVASKSGTKYYLPECAGAARISEANKVWFPSASAAEKAGYAPAANCAGL